MGTSLSPKAKRTARVLSGLTGLIWFMYLVARTFVGGPCGSPTLVANFEPDQYLGVWYELRRDVDIQFESGECVTA